MDEIKLHNTEDRINSIYKIRDKQGKIVTFKPNTVQRKLYDGMHRRNVIPKARQHGITTAIALYFLDQCLMHSNQRAAIVAHRETDALKIFETKIKFPFKQIEQGIKDVLADAVKITSNTIQLNNGSVITADTMVRSDTLNFLHVSELGKMSAWYPIKAEEVKTGAFPAAEKGIIFVESTMEGATGLMAELCETSRKNMYNEKLSEKDFKFFFFPWWESEDYILNEEIIITKEEEEYFEQLRIKNDIILSDAQRAWYVKERSVQGDRMRQEYPSVFEETIQASVEGSFFAKQIDEARYGKRICNLPYDSHLRCYASMDIGINDSTAIWIFQIMPKEIHFIDYYEMSGEELGHYMNWLISKPYSIDRIFLPHDAGARSQHTGKTYDEIVRKEFNFRTKVLERDSHESIGIEGARSTLPKCWFDLSKCSRGIECLSLFKKQYNRKENIYTGKSCHDEYSDGAKSFIYAIKGAVSVANSEDTITVEQLRKIRDSNRRIV